MLKVFALFKHIESNVNVSYVVVVLNVFSCC